MERKTQVMTQAITQRAELLPVLRDEQRAVHRETSRRVQRMIEAEIKVGFAPVETVEVEGRIQPPTQLGTQVVTSLPVLSGVLCRAIRQTKLTFG